MPDRAIRLNLRTGNVHKAVHDATLKVVQDTFRIDIKARAKELSPVSDANPQIPGTKYRFTGNNRRSIDVDVEVEPQGVMARLFSQSGYGGYLEIGTRLMKARPYMYPAFHEFVAKIPGRIREVLRGRR